jgi:hypothetical protein
MSIKTKACFNCIHVDIYNGEFYCKKRTGYKGVDMVTGKDIYIYPNSPTSTTLKSDRKYMKCREIERILFDSCDIYVVSPAHCWEGREQDGQCSACNNKGGELAIDGD